VANRNRGRGRRSRKRRPAGVRAAGEDAANAASGQAPSAGRETARKRESSPGPQRRDKRARPGGAAGRSEGAHRDSSSVGERPRAPWHPLPLSELLILVGAIGILVGLSKGISHGSPALFTGIAAVLIGTVEVTLREHLSGYRSHTLILTLLPVIVFHSVVVLGITFLIKSSQLWNVGTFVVDSAMFVFLFRLLRARFVDARRERTFAGRR
jgi:hypothetical protein